MNKNRVLVVLALPVLLIGGLAACKDESDDQPTAPASTGYVPVPSASVSVSVEPVPSESVSVKPSTSVSVSVSPSDESKNDVPGDGGK